MSYRNNEYLNTIEVKKNGLDISKMSKDFVNQPLQKLVPLGSFEEYPA